MGTSLRRTLAVAGGLGLVLVPAAFLLAQAGAPSGLQITPDGKRTLINKDVGDERWAITLNQSDGSVTGNVFFPGGGEPAFLWCQATGSSGGERSFACQGASRCPLAPCPPNEWAFIGDVTLPESFFLPRPEEAPQSSLPGRALGSAAGSPSGLQITPDETRTLISKDVGGERWAITLNPEDGTVTGNVFFPGGGEPAFLWCEQTGADGENLTFACQGADRCTSSSCSPDLWAFIGDVTLPASFFAPRETVTIDEVAGAIEEALGADGGFDALMLALDRGYSLRQIVRAALSRRLLASGEIQGQPDGIEPPDGPPLGLFLTTSASAEGVRGGPISLEELRRAAQEDAEALGFSGLNAILNLLQQGYTPDQIVEGIILGQLDKRPECEPLCLSVEPGGDPSEFLTGDSPDPGPSPTPAPTPEPTSAPDGCVLDGVTSGVDEDCDPGDPQVLVDVTCEDVDPDRFGPGGTLRCNDDCEFDTSGCVPNPTPEPAPEPDCPGTRCGDTCFEEKNLLCCDDGGACLPNSVCVDGGCCPETFPQPCPVNGCAPAGADCCTDSSFCPLGSFCDTGECCGLTGSICGFPQDFPRRDREKPAT